jgi:hypothetical protein
VTDHEIFLFVAVVLSAAVSQAANAASITFTASGFRPGLGINTNAPVDPVKGMFWIKFDPTVLQGNGTNILLSWQTSRRLIPLLLTIFRRTAGNCGCAPLLARRALVTTRNSS